MDISLKNIVKLALVFGIIFLFINELVSVSINYFRTPDIAEHVAEVSAEAYAGSSSELDLSKQIEARDAAIKEAKKEGAELIFWEIRGGVVTLTIKSYPKHTLVLNRIAFVKDRLGITATASARVVFGE